MKIFLSDTLRGLAIIATLSGMTIVGCGYTPPHPKDWTPAEAAIANGSCVPEIIGDNYWEQLCAGGALSCTTSVTSVGGLTCNVRSNSGVYPATSWSYCVCGGNMMPPSLPLPEH
jgi:hypothetical protein